MRLEGGRRSFIAAARAARNEGLVDRRVREDAAKEPRILTETVLNHDHIACLSDRSRAWGTQFPGRKLDKTSGENSRYFAVAGTHTHRRSYLFVVASLLLLGQPFFPQQRRPTCQHRKTLFCTLVRRKIGK